MGIANEWLTWCAHTIDCPVKKRKWMKPLSNWKKLHNYIFSWGNFETFAGRAEQQSEGDSESIRNLFFLQILLLIVKLHCWMLYELRKKLMGT